MARLFIAVPASFDPASCEGVARLLARLKSSGADYKWADPALLHLTLSFHGAALPEQIPALKAAVAQAADGRQAFDLEWGGLGAFDSLDNPRVVWLGVGRGAEPLGDLAGALRQALDRAGLLSPEDKSREFKAHLTLGRMKSRRNLPALKALLKPRSGEPALAMAVDRIVLVESRLGPAGPSYRDLYSVGLGRRS